MSNMFIVSPFILIVLGVVALIFSNRVARVFPVVGALILGYLFTTTSGIQSFSYKILPTEGLSIMLQSTKLGTLFYAITAVSLLIYGISILGRTATTRKESDSGFVLLAMGGMGILFFAQDFLTFFVGWEIMTWSSYVPLLGRGKNSSASRRYLTFNLGGATSLLTGIMILFSKTESLNFNEIIGVVNGVDSDITVAFILIVVGFLLKAAIIPFHRWLPDAYSEAEDNFTGFLSGAISKAAVFGLILITFRIYGSADKTIIMKLLSWLGGFTALFATFRAITQIEIKRLLAWSSIAQLGYILVAIGVSTNIGLSAAIYHSINHTIIKLLLFTITAGIIAETGKTRFDQLGGLIKVMPLSFIGILMGIISLAGMPPLSGFNGKWLVYSSLIEHGDYFLLIIVITSSTAAFLYCYKLIYGLFLGHPTEAPLETTKEISWSYRISALIMMALLILFGMFPSYLFVVINPILLELGITTLAQGSFGYLQTSIGGYDGALVMTLFGSAFAIILALFSLVKSKSRNLHRLDIAYAAEIPTEETPLHYGSGIGSEIHRIPYIGAVLKRTTQVIYDYIYMQISNLASFARLLYTGNIRHLMGVAILATIVLFYFLVNNGGGK